MDVYDRLQPEDETGGRNRLALAVSDAAIARPGCCSQTHRERYQEPQKKEEQIAYGHITVATPDQMLEQRGGRYPWVLLHKRQPMRHGILENISVEQHDDSDDGTQRTECHGPQTKKLFLHCPPVR